MTRVSGRPVADGAATTGTRTRGGQALRLLAGGVSLVALTVAMVALEERLDLDNVLLLYLLAVVVIAIAVGRVAAAVTAVVSYMFATYWFAAPRGHLHLNHEDHWVELTVFLVVAVLVGLVADGAGRRRQQLAAERARNRELADLERVRAGLLSAVSHDLRTPLSGIKANASALRYADSTWPQEVRWELLTYIEDAADQLTDLVSNVLLMTRIRAGALQADMQAVAVYEVVARGLMSTGSRLEQPGASVPSTTVGMPVTAPVVKVEVPEDLPLVLADPTLLERVIANLVANALEHAADGGSVLVWSERTESGVRVSVVDHGPGIAEDRWETAFQPFQRLGDTGGGIGLGLATASGFCEAMGTTLTPSHTPGGGLTMSVDLKPPPPGPSHSSHGAAGGSGSAWGVVG